MLPSGDSQALPGYISLYLQISDPGNNNSKWDCFASYRLSVRNLVDDSKSVHRDSWHRFSAKKKSHGVCTARRHGSGLGVRARTLGRSVMQRGMTFKAAFWAPWLPGWPAVWDDLTRMLLRTMLFC